MKKDLEKLAYENPNNFELGSKVRQMLNVEDTLEQINWREKYLSLAAEFDNFRKRVLKEKEELVIKTKSSMIEPILDLDNDLGIALKHSKDQGLKLILAKLTVFLQTQGIQTIQTETYDENIHEVVSLLPSDNVTETILDVVSKGYSIGDKIIRYPKIILSE